MSDQAAEWVLTSEETRVLGALVEKELSTPDYYPLTLNALTLACNQSSNRDPVVAYDEATVVRALDRLRERKLAFLYGGGASRVPRFGHKLADTLVLERPELAILCVLLLRGPQTLGEIKSRTARLHEFASLEETETALDAFAARPTQPPLIVKLPRQPGNKEPRYAHLLNGPVAPQATAMPPVAPPPASPFRADSDRLFQLENEVAALKADLAAIKASLGIS